MNIILLILLSIMALLGLALMLAVFFDKATHECFAVGYAIFLVSLATFAYTPYKNQVITENIKNFTTGEVYYIKNGGNDRTLEINIQEKDNIENKILKLSKDCNTKKIYKLDKNENPYIEYTVDKYVFRGDIVNKVTIYLPKKD